MRAFKRVLVEIFDEHCDLGLYMLKYYLSGRMVGDPRKLETLSILASSPYEHFHAHTKRSYSRILQRRRTRIMETVNVLQRRYKTALTI